MFTIEHHAGRLIETRAKALASEEEVAEFGEKFRTLVTALPESKRVVICGDYRDMHILSPKVAERFVAMLTNANPRVERSGILCSPDHATALLQIERTVKQANNPSRRTFRTSDELHAWLGEVLDADERVRLRIFLA